MTDALPWRSERALDAARVSAIVDARFPHLAPARAAFLDEGWDSEVYLVAGEWVVRFPKRAEVVPSQRLERALLPRLADALPVPVPRPALLGEPGPDFPFPFLGYRRLSGVPMLRVPQGTVDEARVARSLAAFLSRLHAFPTDEARALGVPEPPARDPAVADERHAAVWRRVRGAVPAALAARGDVAFASPPPPPHGGGRRLVHGDVTYDHVLLREDGGDVAGVIDWADACLGDPAVDFAGLLAWFGEPFVLAVLARYDAPVGPGLLARARRVALHGSVAALWWGVGGGRPQDVAGGLRGLAHALA